MPLYELIAQELVEPNSSKRYLGSRGSCRYCFTSATADFGRRGNAHAFPAALGNKALFSLNECKNCNNKFSVYEDALVKAVGPFLTLGGVAGRNGVRQTGRSNSMSKIRHSSNQSGRRLTISGAEAPDELFRKLNSSENMSLRFPITGDAFVPRYAYKALLKLAVALLPNAEVPKFRKAIESLSSIDELPYQPPLQLGFSHAYVGNAPPALAGHLLRRVDDDASVPYVIFLFMAGSVCFQIWVKSDEDDANVPNLGKLGLRFTAQIPKP